MKQSGSAIFRLTLIISTAIVASASIAMLAIYLVTAQHLDTRMKALLEADLAGFSELYAQRRIIAVRQAFERRALAPDTSGMVLLLLDKKGKKLAGNIEQWPDIVPQDNSWQTFTLDLPGIPQGRYFGAGAQLPGPFPILVARSLEPRDALLFQLRWAMAAALVVILLVGTGLGYLLGRRILARISRLNEVCEQVEKGALDTRVVDPTSDEFGTLGRHINRMLERISALVAGTREISDHIAHELRTPLNRILLRIENLQGNGAALTGELDEVRGDMKETIAIFEALLDIATTEAETGDTSALKPVDLAGIITEMAELYGAVAEERNIALLVELEKPAMILGDENLLTRALANLLDNAIKFSPDGGNVHVSLSKESHHHLLEIEDSGPGLDANIEGRAFERFVRGGNFVKTPGHGLGLAIVRAIAIRHGIKISLANKPKGLCVTLRCPAYQFEPMEKQ